MDEIRLSADAAKALEAYERRLQTPWTSGWTDDQEKACQEAGLLVDFWARERLLHPTNRTARFGAEEEVPLLVDNNGQLWGQVHRGQPQVAPPVYAPWGTIEGAGPLVPRALLSTVVTVLQHRCDCGWGGGTLEEIWGSPQERDEAVEALIASLQATRTDPDHPGV